MTKFTKTLSVLALAALASAAHADVVNGGFAGLSGWTTAGDASTDAAGLLLTTASTLGDGAGSSVSGTDAVSADALEPFVGVAPGALSLDPLTAAAYEGSAARQTFSLAAAGNLSFRWNLGTADTSGDPGFADTAFAVVDGKLYTLGNILQVGASGSTGWASFAGPALGAGAHTIAFGLVDEGDTTGLSTLSVADVGVSAVPEAPALAMMVAGLGLVGVARRRRG